MKNKKRNPRWNRNEIILALDLYFDLNGIEEESSNPKIVEVSRVLNLLAAPEFKDLEKFRNANAVALKLQNFKHFDPKRPGGLSRGGKLDGIILNEFYDNRENLRLIAAEIRNSIR